MDRADLPPGARVPVDVFTGLAEEGAFVAVTSAPETPGNFTFPPVAAAITAGARLMLALAERLVTDAGGTYALMDTDSIAVVATGPGGSVPCPGGPLGLPDGSSAIRALSFAEVEALRAHFERLNPYDRSVVPGSILQVEPRCLDVTGQLRVLTCVAVSAKRYVLVDPTSKGVVDPQAADGGVAWEDEDFWDEEAPWDSGEAADAGRVVKNSEHGLGGYVSPAPGWIREFWAAALESVETGSRLRLPDWAGFPAMHQLTVSTAAIQRGFQRLNQSRCEGDRVRPGTFILAAQITSAPVGVDPSSFRLVGPYERSPQRWLHHPWLNLHPTRRWEVEDLEQVRHRWEQAQLAAEEWAGLRNRVVALGGLRPDRDHSARVIPAPVRRRSGQAADEMARALGFDSADSLIAALAVAWEAHRTAESRRMRRPEWPVEPPGAEFRIDVGELEVEDERTARVATIGEVLTKYLRHPEAKSLGPDGARCNGYTVGLLRPRPVRVSEVRFIGKEATAFEERAAGIVPSREAAVNEYRAPGTPDPLWKLALPVLIEAQREKLACEVGTDRRHLQRVLQGRKYPGLKLRERLIEAAEARAHADLGEAAAPYARVAREAHISNLLTHWATWRMGAPRLCAGCGEPLPSGDPRRLTHSARCRDAAYRRRRREAAS